MTTASTTRSGAPATRGCYFYLSYAHSAPPSDMTRTDTDQWVGVFYRDLTEAIRGLADPTAGLAAGFFDDLVPPGSDWNAALKDALGEAEVFVALYSEGYFKKSWPLRERESFLQRLRLLEGVVDRQMHVLPVLWIPLLSWKAPPEVRDALELGEGVPAYKENGLRALCMLPSYRKQYTAVVAKIARRVVTVAERSPVGPSPAPAPEDVVGNFEAETQFVIAVVAPTIVDRPPGRADRTYGAEPTDWRPFADDQAVPLARYIANTAERLGLPARTVAYLEDPSSVRHSSATVLIDPWVAADHGGAAKLRSILARLPEWVMALVVVDPRDPQYHRGGQRLARMVAGMLTRSGPPQIIEAQDVRQFIASVPVLVTEARRRYLKHGPAYPPKEHSPAGTSTDQAVPPNPRKQAHG